MFAQLARRIAGTTAAVALAVAGMAVPAGAETARVPERPIRVMSYNIHHAQGTDGRLDLQRVADVIRASKADVVGLQEVDRHWSDRSGLVDQAAWLGEELGMDVVYGANLDEEPAAPGQPRRQYGTAILSRHRILDWSNTYLPRYEGHEQRGLLRARVKVRGVTLQVFDTHLQHDNADERVEQARAVRGLIGTPAEPYVLTGDLNATPAAPEIRILTDGLRDAWTEAGRGEGHTHPAEAPEVRIDYVLTSSKVRTTSAEVVTSDGSDHLPVVAGLVIPKH